MDRKLKRVVVLGTLISGLFIAITACSFKPTLNNASSQPQSTSINDSTSNPAPSSSMTSVSGSEKVEEPPVVLENISVSGNKESYEYGEDLDVVVMANYSDGTSIAVTDYEVDGFDSNKPGKQTITFTHEGKTCTLDTIVNAPALVGITAISNKESYEYGEDLDVVVMAHYADDSSKEIKNYDVDGFDSKNPGRQTLTFSFEGKSCSLDVAINERINLFPLDQMNAFIQSEDIKTNTPSPIGYDEWENETKLEQDGSKYFYATTKDEGKVGSDSIADQYAVLLEKDGWLLNKDNETYSATKEEGDVILSFGTKDGIFSLNIAAYEEFPTKKISASMVRTKASLNDGDTVILGNIGEEYVASGFENNSLASIDCVFNVDKIENVSKKTWRFVVNKTGSYYTLTDIHGRKLGATGLNNLAWDEGSTEWAITISRSTTSFVNANSEYGKLCFNVETRTLSTYKDAVSGRLISPQIFKTSEVDIIYPEGISLSGKEEISTGKSSQLNVSYMPSNSNALNTVEWSSSDESIATVKNGVVKGISAGQVTITAKTKSKRNYIETSFEVEVTEVGLDNWTIMVYMCGSDLESDHGLASTDIAEMLNVSNQPDDVNIIIETGGTTEWKKYNIDANALSRYHIENKKLVLDEKLQKDNMGKQSVFESFLNWGLQNYPAKKTGVILWNHGGAMDGVCFDDSIGTSNALLNSETSSAFKNVFSANNIDKKLEFVGYDACLMQVQDIAESNSQYFKYMVGSEEAEVGEGWVYSTWVDDLYSNKDTQTILSACVSGFVSRYGGNQTLSYLDLSKVNNYYTKFEAMASAIKNTAKSNYSSFKSLIKKVKDYGDVQDYWYSQNGLDAYGTIDGMDFLNKLGNESKYSSYKAEIDAAKEAYLELVAFSKCGSSAGASNGLAIIAPINSYVSYPTAETSFTTWRSIFK